MTWPPQQDPACVQCGGPLGASPSEDFCGDGCQMAWHSKSADHRIVRPPVVRERVPHVPPATWPTLAIPHPDGGLTYARSREEYQRYLEDTAPAEPPPELPEDFRGRTVMVTADRRVSIDLSEQRPSIIRRILNATKRKES